MPYHIIDSYSYIYAALKKDTEPSAYVLEFILKYCATAGALTEAVSIMRYRSIKQL
jgi:hypothetical protein